MRLSAAQAQGLAVLLGWVDFHLRDSKTLGCHRVGNFTKDKDSRCIQCCCDCDIYHDDISYILYNMNIGERISVICCLGILYLYFFVPSQAHGQSDNDALRAENEELAKQACLNLSHNDLTAETAVHDITDFTRSGFHV